MRCFRTYRKAAVRVTAIFLLMIIGGRISPAENDRIFGGGVLVWADETTSESTDETAISEEEAARRALISEYFQTVDANGNVIEGDLPFVADTSEDRARLEEANHPESAERTSQTTQTEKTREDLPFAFVRSASEDDAAVIDINQIAAADTKTSAEEEAVRAMSSDFFEAAEEQETQKLPLIPIIGGVLAAVLLAVGILILRKKKKSKATEESGEDASAEESAAGKKGFRLKKPKAKPVKEAKAKKIKKEKKKKKK